MTQPIEHESPAPAFLSISVIIPVLNEVEQIAELIRTVRALNENSSPRICEIIVVDGGSDDGTLQAATEADFCLSSAQGRGIQQNEGARVATGDILLFLHADCQLKAGAFAEIQQAMNDQRNVAGCFSQRINAAGLRYRLLEWGNAWRVRLLGWAYGDQAIFVRRTIFEAVGQFPDLQLMDDLFLMKRLKKVGRIALLKSQVTVSARRWQQHGIIRQTFRNWAFITLAHCGVSPNSLTRFYPNVRDKPKNACGKTKPNAPGKTKPNAQK